MKRTFLDDNRVKLMSLPEHQLSYEQSKFFDGGYKAIEVFETDIYRNIMSWSCDKNSIFYETETYWYTFLQ